jgi:hypothetical protein
MAFDLSSIPIASQPANGRCAVVFDRSDVASMSAFTSKLEIAVSADYYRYGPTPKLAASLCFRALQGRLQTLARFSSYNRFTSRCGITGTNAFRCD